MILRFSAAICAAMFLTTSTAMAGTTGNGWSSPAPRAKAAGYNWIQASFDKGYSRSASSTTNRVIITLHVASTSTWAYDPASGSITQLPQPVENVSPTTGIGIVVKKNPGSSAVRLSPSPDGMTFALPDTMDSGNYDIVITVPGHAINTKGTGAQNGRTMAPTGATISIPIAVGTNGKIRRFNAELYVEKMAPVTP